ncbi:MAG: Mur ligase family protein [Gemmatimonadota bacterium]
MTPLLVFLIFMAVWLAYLAAEAVRLGRNRAAVPLRVAVTGTRGKTTVTRLLAAVLSEDGKRVLAKTTGSEAAYLFPDGSIQEIRRLGAPSIIEQKRLLKRGAKLGVDVVLAEVMSLHPENHRVEVQQILQPHLVLVTNFRVDHMEAHGRTRREVASVLALDVPPGVRAFLPEAEWEEGFQELVTQGGGEVVRVPEGVSRPPEGCGEFGTNLDLVWAAARFLGVKEEVIREGICKAQGDVGTLKSWRYHHDQSPDPWLLVNAFAANDPESTMGIHRRILESRRLGPEACIGLLGLRSDRGDRSLQWAEALEAGALMSFRRLFVAGLHAHALRHRLRHHPEARRIEILRPSPPEGIMTRILGMEREGGGILFGFGNIAGLGLSMVEHWRKVGEPHGI